MDRRILVYAACLVTFIGMTVASCPSGEKYCSDRRGCVSTSQNCSDGDIQTCVNMTASCHRNGTIHCLNVANYTCGNISCGNMTKYCPKEKDCIDVNEHCCTEREDACKDVVEFKYFFTSSKTLHSICELLASDNGNFSSNYTKLKYHNPLEDTMCDNGTYFCPLVLQCIPMNHSCNPERVYGDNELDVFQEDCGVDKTFCPLYMRCIPSSENCSYKALFDWYDAGNKSKDLFDQPCPMNQTFCLLTFSCQESCDRQDVMNKSCNATDKDMCPERMECGMNDTKCKRELGPGNFTNATDGGSGWLETCKYRKLIKTVLWEKASECKPYAERCKKDEKKCDFEICSKLHYINNLTDWIWDQLETKANVEIWVGGCNFTVNHTVLQNCNLTMEQKNRSCDARKLCQVLKEKMEYWNMSMNGSIWLDECNITIINASAKLHECNATKHHKNKSCDAGKLCDVLKEKMKYGNMSVNGSIWLDECNITISNAKIHECNLTKHHKNKSCDARKLCYVLEAKMEHWNMSMNGSMWLDECNITINASAKIHECNLTKHHKNKSCDARKLCYVLEEKMKYGNMSMNGSMWLDECNITINTSAKIHECNLTKHHKNKSCDARKLCYVLKEKMKYGNMSMNGSMWLDECNITISNTSAKIHECNLTKHHKNKSCDARKLCYVLEEKMKYGNMSMNGSMWLDECNITINTSAKIHECNLTKHHKNKSCNARKLCDVLEEKMKYGNMSVNDSMWLDECNVTINTSAKIHECNLTKHHKSKSCDARKLCYVLEEKMKYGNMSMNDSMWLDECNITINVSAKIRECNLTKHHKNKSCDARKLCDVLEEKMKYGNMSMSGSMWLDECNITINTSAKIHECNLIKHHKNKSCDARKLCYVLEEKMKYGNMSVNGSMWLDECNITINASTKVYECNLTKHRKMNRSCEINTLCKPLIENKYNESNMNKTIRVKGCDVEFNETVIRICNISFRFCKIEDLCPRYRELAVNHTKESFPKTVEGCKVDWDDIKQCNITFPKNGSDCNLKKLCKPIKENNYNMSMVNKTLRIDDCVIRFDQAVFNACNITFKPGCKIEDLCPKYRALALNHTIYSFPKYIGKCKVNRDNFDQCNVTVQMSMDYHYKIFFNGFKISDSVERTVTHIAVRGFGLARDDGQWEYQNSGIWIRLGPVSSHNATVLPSNIRLRFKANNSSWHGPATLMYTPVKGGDLGSTADVSDTLHDPRNTLALLQSPSPPVANFSRFIGDPYTVGEDEVDRGFMIGDRIEMSLSHAVMDKSMNGNVSEYLKHLPAKIVENYNETVKCFERFQAAIAVVEVGKASEGTWQVNGKPIVNVDLQSVKVVKPNDLLRFVPAQDLHGNWSMRFMAVAYGRCSGSMKKVYFDAPTPLAHALKGVMMIRNTSKQVKILLEKALKLMATNVSYTLENFNGVVERLSASTDEKNELKDIAAKAFDSVTLPNELRPSRFLTSEHSLTVLYNPHTYTFSVHVTPINDQPVTGTPRFNFPAIAYNITTTPISGKLVKDFLTEAKATDIDGDELGIAIVQALNTSIGSWYYKSPWGIWTQIIIDNPSYSDSLRGNISVMVLNSSYYLKFQMHNNDTLWSNVEASAKAKIVCLSWDGSDDRTIGWRNIKRPSEAISAYSKRSVTAIVQRKGCDGRAGSKGRIDRCGICGGDDTSCMGCDGVLNSGAVIDSCGNCTGGKTNVSFDAMQDCAGECGLSFNDTCGICQRKKQFVNFTDCTGLCFGLALTNDCGNCVGGTSGKPITFGEDACGICGGDNSTCTDCEGVPNGGKYYDSCLKCLDLNDTRRNRECVKLTNIVPNSGPSHGGMKVIVLGATLGTYSTVRCAVNGTSDRKETLSSSVAENKDHVIEFISPPLVSGYYTVACIFDSEDVWYTVEETFFVYNKSSITYTSISPDSIDINMAETAVITGSGFVNTSDIACVSHYNVFEAEFVNSTSVLCSIPSTKDSVRLSLAISFSRGDRGLGESLLNFTIYAKASKPVSAKFTDNLQAIKISFNVPTKSRQRSVLCSTFFAQGNASSFGTRSKCFFPTSRQMIIALQGDPSIVPNDTLRFRLHSITQRHQKVTREPLMIYQDLVVAPPSVSVIPKAKVEGSEELGICAILYISGSLSYGSGGRPLIFIWDVEWADPEDSAITENATADLNATRQYLRSLDKFQKVVRAPNNSMIVVGPRYKFKLKVKNFLGEESEEVTLIVQRQDKSVPVLNVGAKVKKMKAALGVSLQGKVQLSSCLPEGYKPLVLFTWEIQAVGVNLEVTDKSRLTIKPRSLIGDREYTVTLTAVMASDITLATTATMTLDVESSPLNAVIKGGDTRVVGEDDTFILDGSRSSDPDGSSEVARYNWECLDSEENPCFEPNPSKPGRKRRMLIPTGVKATIDVAAQLNTNNTYKFRLMFNKGTRNSEASISVFVKSGAPPSVLIRPLRVAKVNPTKSLVIESLIRSKKSINAVWTCVQSEEYGYIDLSAFGVVSTPLDVTFVKENGKAELFASPSLLINANQLENGVTYKFQLAVNHSDSSSYADFEVTTNSAPSQGSLVVEPPVGFFGNTSFTLNAADGWNDDLSDLPLTFFFGYYIQDPGSVERREEPLEIASERNSLIVDFLPEGDAANNYSLTVFVKVSDIYGAVTVREASVIVKPTPLDTSTFNELSGGVVRDMESGDLGKGLAKANALLVAVLLSVNVNDPNTTTVVREFKKDITVKVLISIEGGGIQDKSSRDVVKGSLLQTTSGCRPDCNPARVLRSLFIIEVESQSPSKRRRRAVVETSITEKTAAEVESTLKISQNVIDPEDYTNSSLGAKSTFLSIVKAQEPSLCKGLATGGPFALVKSNITVMRVVKRGWWRAVEGAVSTIDNDFHEVSTSTAPEYIEASVLYRLGLNLKTEYESWPCTNDDTCTGTCIATAQFKDDLLIQHDPAEKNLTRLSDVTSLRLYNPQTLHEISVSGLENAVALRFPIDNAEMYENYTKECRVWHEGSKEWQTAGCSVYKSNKSIIECTCTQLGYIAVFLGEQSRPTTPPSTQKPTNGPTAKPEESLTVEFAFDANYSQVISGNTTKAVFISHLGDFLADRLNISRARITNMDIRSGSIIVTFTILPSNDTNENSVNSTVLNLERLVKTNAVYFTLPGSNIALKFQSSSFKIVTSTTTPPPKVDDGDDDDDDGLSTAEIVIIVVVCVLVVIALIAALLYYFKRVKPARAGKVSPHGSHMQLNEQQNNNQFGMDGLSNNAVTADEKAV